LEVRERLQRLDAKGSPGLGARIAEVFLSDTAIRLAALRDALARRDGEAAYRIAHTIEGSAAMVGAASMARSCTELTAAARSGAFDVCEALLADLDAGFAAIRRAVTPEGSSAPTR
jgi:HPt (histidine-containing phosphotransfer) domain-containing protein